MDPTTGEVLAYVGSYDYYGSTPQMQGDYDHAGIAYRQPGSTFKLFTYLAGMEKAGHDRVRARCTTSSGPRRRQGSIKPQGCDEAATRADDDPSVLRESLNLPALQVTRAVGVDSIVDMVQQLGINRDWDR